MQLELFTNINPFKVRFLELIDESVPNLPGIYRFYSKSGELLYVGKSKNLKNRLKSYTYINQAKVSKRLIRLIYLVQKIEFEQTLSEEYALLLENKWLRTQKPPFNKVNTKPELYVYVGFSKKDSNLEIGWTLDEDQHPFEHLYGAYKGVSNTFAMMCALRRLNEALNQNSIQQKKLFIRRPPLKFESSSFTQKWLINLLNGENLNCELFTDLIQKSSGFKLKIILQDISTLMRWFVFQGLTNRAIKNKFNIKSSVLRNEHLDDWLVKLNSN